MSSVFKSNESRDFLRDNYNTILSRFPFEQMYLDTGFGRTFLLHAGAGGNPPVILLHGSCSNSVFMSPEIMALSRAFNVFAVDIIGEAGNSCDARPDLHSDDFALWLRDILDALYIKDAIFVGNSLGGWMSLKFATTFPDRVSKLILIAPGGLSGQNTAMTDRVNAAEAHNETLTVDDSVTSGAALPKEVEAFMNLIIASYTPITETLPVFTDGQLKILGMPVLFVAGDQDNMLDAAGAAQRLEVLLPHAVIHLLPNIGHMILNASEYIVPFLLKE